MARVIVAAFVATFIAAIAAIVGVPVLAQTPPPPGADGAPPPDHMTPRERFAAMDTDHDGRISKAEWLAAGRHERGFEMMDTNHDGYLTMDELKAGRERMRAMRASQGSPQRAAPGGPPPQ